MRKTLFRDFGWHVAALTGYAAVSLCFLGHGMSLQKNLFGLGGDPYQFVWVLAWFPYALAHHQSLLYTHLMWQPLGMPMLWISSVPLICLALMPLTALLGPVLLYNLLILAAPVLSALAAYFLCLRVRRDPPAALLGGFVFGFSGYEMAADYATLNLSVTFLLPCLVLLGLWRLEHPGARRVTVGLAALMLIAEFFISIEIFATLIFFGAASWGLAYVIFETHRARLQWLLGDALLTGMLTLFMLSPVLVEMFRHDGFARIPDLWPYYFVSDLSNFFIPTPLTALGGHLFPGLERFFKADLQERDAYFGLPLLIILFLYARQTRRQVISRFMVFLIAGLALASLGPRLWVAGVYTGIPLPWQVFVYFPLLGSALPARFALFLSLAVAVALVLWLGAAADAASRRRRFAAACLACVFLLPAPHPYRPLPHSTFFSPGQVQAVLGGHPRLLVLPFWGNGPGTLWQAQSGFAFDEAGGYFGFPPGPMQHYKVIWELMGDHPGPDFGADLTLFCTQTGVSTIVAGPGTSAQLLGRLRALGWPERLVDDVALFSVPRAARG